MPVNLPPLKKLHSIQGITIGTTNAGIKQTVRDDITLFAIVPDATCAAVFTRNAFCAAPVTIAKKHLNLHNPRYLLINSGNANAGTGATGLQAAIDCCQRVAMLGNCQVSEVLPFSTGVIGVNLPTAKIDAALPQAFTALHADNWKQAAQAIMTTDTVPKGISVQVSLQGQTVTITGIAKGAGMIRPDMATMLAFIATDARVTKPVLETCLQQAVNRSFNRITIDGDTSTNDACVLVATGQQHGVVLNSTHDAAYPAFYQAVEQVCQYLAQAIVRDGEGATKFISVQVEQGADAAECLQVAYTIAHSPLIKTAFFASDANWGRILAAVGRAGLSRLVLEKVEIYLGDVCIVRNGGAASDYTEERGQAVMAQADIGVRVCLGRGNCTETVWTCDFSHDYVTINAEYRT